ncbi:MAG: hypothetical protein J6V80_06560, partial [Clostridia bacterium]|nr:hypothetical protein [Clostridia bacterium]
DNHKKTCECGDVQTASHAWNEGEVTTDPTHTTEGITTYTCTDCGATKTETLDKTPDHSYGAWEKVDADNHKKTCECGDEVILPHAWDEGEVTTPATHTTEGVKTFTCTDCGATKTESIGTTTDHSYGAWENVDADTHKQTCECGDEVILPHAWNEGEVTTPATHTTTGVKTFTCTDCGATKTEEVPVLANHTYNQKNTAEDYLKSAATCTSSAVYYYSCICGAISDTETFTDGDPIAHNFNQENTKLEGALKSAADCENAAVYYKSCSCGAISDTETFEDGYALGHNYGEVDYAWSDDNSICTATRVCANDAGHVETETVNAVGNEVAAPTCEEDGKTVYTATFENEAFADQTKEVTIGALGHDYESAVTAPTCTVEGLRTYTCKNNSEHTYTEEIAIDPTAHTNVNPKDDNCDSCGENLAYTFLVKDNNNNPFAAENGGSAIDNSENLTADKNRLNKASDAYEKTYGSTFTFRVFVEEATTVEFYLFESNKNGATIASTAITKLTVNGNAVTVLDTAIPKTTDWAESTAQYIHIATLNLQKGENVITFVRNGTDFSSTNDINIRGIKLVSNIEVKLDKVNVYEFSIANGNNPFISENGGSYNDDKDEANNPSSGTGGRYGNGGGAELTVTLWVEEDTVVTFRLISAWRDGRYFSYYKNLRSEGADSNNYYNPNISYLKVNGETVGVTPSAVSYSSQGFSTYAHCELATIELKAGVANVISFKINDTKGRGGTGDNVNFKGISIVSDVEVKIGADSE